jgi:hypothetical protein
MYRGLPDNSDGHNIRLSDHDGSGSQPTLPWTQSPSGSFVADVSVSTVSYLGHEKSF